MSSAPPPSEDSFDFIRKLWGSTGFNLPGMVTPSLDVDELERRVTELKAVEGWLKMNLGMLQMSIQGLEVQRTTLAAMQAMNQSTQENQEATNPFANPSLWAWPFSTTDVGTTAETPVKNEANNTASPANKSPKPRRKAPSK